MVSSSLFSQLENFRGVWVSKKADLISIRDIANIYDDANSIGKAEKEIGLNVYLRGDILSFQKKYYTAESDFTKTMIDSFNLRILSKNEKTIVAKPYTKSSSNFFKTKKKITFTKQDFLVDTSLHFQKIVFHTSGCYGSCPIIDLEITKDKEFYINGTFFKDFSMFEIDSTLSGQFKGTMDPSLMKRISFLVQSCNLPSLKVNESLEPDLPITTVIVYYNDEKRAFKFTSTPAILSEMVEFLTLVNQEVRLSKTKNKRVLETY